MSWTDEARDYAISLAPNHSASEIAVLLSKELGVSKTRNAVIGIVNRAGHRLGGSTAPSRDQARKRAAALRRKRISRRTEGRGVTPFNFYGKTPIQATPLPPRHETDIARVSFLELNEDGKRHCKFPIGDIVPAHQKQFCGLEPIPGRAYCPSHYVRCFDTIDARRALALQDAAEKTSAPAEVA